MLRYIENKYVVVKSGIYGIHIGDAVVSVNGLTPSQMEDSMKNYISAGNISVFRRAMYKYGLLGGPQRSVFDLVLADTTGAIDTVRVIRNTLWGDTTIPEYYYPADSLANIQWTTLGCGTGYMNIGNLTVAEARTAYAGLQNAPAIILDHRNYPGSNAVNTLDSLISDSIRVFERVQIPDTSYPGTYYWLNAYSGITGNPTPYRGTIILLFNEESQSFAEVSCLSFSSLPNVIKIGSQTAGTFGSITTLNFTNDIHTGFTYVAFYHPNGDSIQRVGLKADSVVRPTIAGIMAGRDEVVEKALQVACSLPRVAVHQIQNASPSVVLFPNPTDNKIHITVGHIPNGEVALKITSMIGNVLWEKTEHTRKKTFYLP
ncbi:MAG: hypothetical protein EBZ77_17070, partial [Chitinophagia bacterium]|nr:hypothetical protein [Chitinophagia bacterium]